MNLSGIRLITFDLDDTLWPCMPTIIHAENTLYEWLSEAAPALVEEHSIESIRQHRIALSRDNPDISHNLTLTRRLSLEALLSDYGMDPQLAHEAVDVFRQARNQVEPYEEVAEILTEFFPDYCLISVTNGNAEISETPLNGLFHHSLTAEQVGAAKPDPTIFHEAMKLADCGPQETLHIGDDPHTDIHAAHQAGLLSIWIDRYGRIWPEEYQQAHASIKSLDELPALFK